MPGGIFSPAIANNQTSKIFPTIANCFNPRNRTTLIFMCYQDEMTEQCGNRCMFSDQHQQINMSSRKEEKPVLMYFQRQINYRERKENGAKKEDDAKKELRKTRDKLRYTTNKKIPKLMKKIEEVKAGQKKASSKKKKLQLRLKLETLSCQLKELKNEQYNLQTHLSSAEE